jgi:pimeloyl-ACP methyl ester carboxylesterase
MPELETGGVLQKEGALSRTERLIFRTEANRNELVAIYDQRLAEWPVLFDTFFVNTRYGKTHVIASGPRTSPPLVLTHPAGCGSFVWSSIIAALSEAHRTYALDTIGELGRSRLDDHDRYPKTGRDYSAWLDDVSAELGIGSSDVVAGSMGGWIAMNRAIIAPERVRRLVLLGPMGLPTWRATLGVLGPILSLVLRPTDAKLKRMTRRCLGDGERVTRELSSWTQVAFRCHARTGQPLHIPAAKLGLIKSPTLVFLGEKDGLIGSATAAAKRAWKIPDCEIEILPRAGHIMNIDEPELIATRTVKFLASSEPQPANTRA